MLVVVAADLVGVHVWALEGLGELGGKGLYGDGHWNVAGFQRFRVIAGLGKGAGGEDEGEKAE